ncbi:uncharacterized protein LOC111269085 [Varroa jacobsoni]|uniref:Uncharacterized protein n=1 Tax=Varroa destructor TaxID=109461 RepID=A0A7M7JFA1_VARDE|nr:uncharacterized protein LOC111246255 [Varroa destructor]XP_022704182.1 uncharacterized protein LOC111269085 [Varroa jacobsoni]
MEASDQYSAAAPTGVPVATNAAPQAGSAVADGEIQLTMFDKMRRMVSTDEEWDAILLQKMELKRNREQGLPDPPQQPFSIGGAVGNVGAAIGSKVGGVLTKAKGAIPVQLPSMPAMPNIPIPGLNKSQPSETVGDAAAAAASQDYSQVDSTITQQ